MKKNKLFIAAVWIGIVVVVTCGIAYTTFKLYNLTMSNKLNRYLNIYERDAIVYITHDEDILNVYEGENGEPPLFSRISFQYAYREDSPYHTNGKVPKNQDEFENAIEFIQFSFVFHKDERIFTLRFERNDEGALSIADTYWQDEAGR